MTTRLGGSRPNLGPRARCGFTIVELLVAILVIAILIGLLIVAVRAALISARRSGEQQVATGLQTGVGMFQSTFDNQLPPLVYDGGAIALAAGSSLPKITGAPANGDGPVFRGGATPVVSTLEAIYVDGGAQFLTGHEPPTGGGAYPWLFDPERDPRYSKFALPIFLAGVLGEDVDGVSGPGMRLSYTNRRGFSLGGASEVRGVLYQPSSERAIVSSYQAVDEYIEHGTDQGGGLPTGEGDASADETAFVGSSGTALRYYRWKASDEGAVGTGVAPLEYLNIPRVLLDPRTWGDPAHPNGDSVAADLRRATYAIVGAGPNGVFGTEPVALLRSKLGIGSGVADDVVRFRAWDDNVVRVGSGT